MSYAIVHNDEGPHIDMGSLLDIDADDVGNIRIRQSS
jgi:hypothetical protein